MPASEEDRGRQSIVARRGDADEDDARRTGTGIEKGDGLDQGSGVIMIYPLAVVFGGRLP